MSADVGSVSRVPCPHCGGSHRVGLRRCPATGRPLGGDQRLIGQLIDRRYRVVRFLGEGPLGAVYKAEHVTVGKQVALRILPSAFLERPVVLHRFFREARLMSSVNHLRLQQLLDAGLAPEGVAYMAYQYVRGRSFTSVLAEEAPLALSRASTIICQVLEGLEAIHESGFVHRALAPDSVLLQTTASGAEQALLTNFGAAALEADGAIDILSRLAARISPLYLAPERLRGEPPDRREDIFAAGVLLAASLSPAGVPRFGSDLIVAGIPPTVEAIVARATHPGVNARFGAASEMRAALRPYATQSQEEPSSATRTHVSDLRALARRERALGTPPARLRFSVAGDGDISKIEGDLGGSIVRAMHTLLPAAWPELQRRVPGLEKARDAKGAELAVPVLLIAAALEEGDTLLGAGDRLFCSAVGEQAARTELIADLKRREQRLTPEFFFDQMAREWAERIGRGTARVSQTGRGYGRLEIRDQEDPSLAVCACLTGILSATLTALGAHGVEVNKTACEAVGDPACVYSATWS